jgi:hypothetical protein
MQRIVCISLLLLLVGCSWQTAFRPRPITMPKGPPENAPELYKKGWNDGCETGMSEFATTFYKSFYRFKQDFKLVENPEYYEAWKDSYTYCRHQVYKWAWDPMTVTGNKLFQDTTPLCVICPDQRFRN